MTKKLKEPDSTPDVQYDSVLGDISNVINAARRSASRSVNCIMTAAYWLIGRRIVEYEQGSKVRAKYGTALLGRLSTDLTNRYGRGFGIDNLQRFRAFYLAYPPNRIYATVSREFGLGQVDKKHATLSRISQAESSEEADEQVRRTASKALGGRDFMQTVSAEFSLLPGPQGHQAIFHTGSEKLPALSAEVVLRFAAECFPLPWSAYVRLLSVKNENARRFYEAEAQRGGWAVRQLDRQINSQFYERTALSRNKAAMLTKGQETMPEDRVPPEEEIKDPFVLEFLGLKDEYSETDLEEALIRHLETFLLELGGDFCFIGRQKRLRVGDEWYRVDLVFFHRRLRFPQPSHLPHPNPLPKGEGAADREVRVRAREAKLGGLRSLTLVQGIPAAVRPFVDV